QADPQGRFDVLFKKRGDKAAQTAKFQLPVLSAAVNNWGQYANNPLQYQLSEKLAPQLREYLGQELPDYMVPAHFMFLDKLPLTPNGKVDRKALPNPDIQPTSQIIAPRSETQTLLASLWSDVLKIDVNSITAHFFNLGGHSLLATRLVSRIRDSFGLEMPLRTLFECPKLNDLAQWIDQQQRGKVLPSIESLPADQPLVLSYAQQRLWFLAQLEGPSATYNMPMALELKGPLNIPALQNTLAMLVERQQCLRLSFPEVDGEACVQEIPAYNPLTVNRLSDLVADGHPAELQQLVNEHANQSFDLANGPLFSIHLLTLGDNHNILLFNMHHIISDGWSMDVLIREWVTIYDALSKEQSPNLKPLPIQYTDYAAWQRNWLQGEVLQGQLDYWKEKLQGAPELLQLPTDFPRPAVQSYRGAHLLTQIEPQLFQQLQSLSRQQGCTLFMTLLTAFNVLLYRYTGQADIPVGSAIANRTQSKIENLVGFFVNTLVLRTQVTAG
ncbi:MAG: condensation domain-containing protein, partial [Psychrosphaera sp.]|nr:condensation domain-containing protein [Psychrosphaera sp.]